MKKIILLSFVLAISACSKEEKSQPQIEPKSTPKLVVPEVKQLKKTI